MKDFIKHHLLPQIIFISLFIVIGVVCFGVSSAMAQVNTSDNVTCRLKINGLCYNATFVKNVNNTAQTIVYDPNVAIVVTSEPTNQPKSYILNSSISRKFYLHNNSTNPINVEVRAYFYPVALIEYGSYSMSKIAQALPVQYVSLGSKETKEVNFVIPTSQVTLSANMEVDLRNVDNPNTGISYAYYSQPFSIYNPSDSLATCQGFTFNNNFGKYMCTSDVFIPLGNIGCISSDRLPTGQQCLANHLYPTTYPRDRSSENIKILTATVYLTDDPGSISSYSQIVSGALSQLQTKIADIKKYTGSPKSISIDQRNCSATRSVVLNYLNQISTSSISAITDGLLAVCGLSRTNYTHTFINFDEFGLSDSDLSLITSKMFLGVPAKGIYRGDGILVSSLVSTDDWPVILHEMTHSFGAPDLYTQNYVYGSTYLWGDCQLMKHDSFDQSTPLCPLENLYWGAANSNSPITQTVTPSASTVNSGDSVKLTFTFPSNTVRASLYLACPSGVTGAYDDVCNKFIDVTSSSDYTATFLNNSSKIINIVPNYYVYLSTNPNYAIGVSSQISVKPVSTSTPPIVQATSTTNIKLLVLLAKFQNTVTEPYNKSYMQGQVFTNSDSVKKIYEKVSYGRMSVTGDVFGWYTIPDTADDICNKTKWMDDAELIAKQNGVDIGKYTHIVIALPAKSGGNYGCPFDGEGYPFHVLPRALVFSPDVYIIAHELGHTFGLGHANGLDCGQDIIKTNYHSTCTIIDYLDPFDFMGRGDIAGTGQQNTSSLNAPNRIALGLFLPTNIQSITTSGTYTIHALETPSTAVQVLKIKKPDSEVGYSSSQNDYYAIEYNPNVEYDSGKSVDGVTIRIFNQDRGYGTLMLDMTPKSCIPSPLPGGCRLHSDWSDGMLKDGMTFVDNNGIRVTQISHTNTEVTVTITLPQVTIPTPICPTGYTCIPGTPTTPQPMNCPSGYICTTNQPTTPNPPTTQTGQSVTPSASTINSGDSVRFNFIFPTNTVKASLNIACPSGVTTGANPEVCNKDIDVTSSGDWSSSFFNSTLQVQNIVPNYYVYLSTNPNYAVRVSSQVSVKPISTSIPPVTQTGTSVTPSASTINSGSSVRLTFKFPPNAVRASLYLVCPNGVTAGAINICNQYKDVTSNGDYSIPIYNSSSQSQNITVNYYVYLSSNPNDAVQASSQITVRPTFVSASVSYTNQGMTASVWGSMWGLIKSLFSSK